MLQPPLVGVRLLVGKFAGKGRIQEMKADIGRDRQRCCPVVTSRSQRRLASWAYATCSSAWTPACFTLRIFMGCRAVAGSEPLVILSQTQTRHARNICPRLARLLMILTRPPAPNTPLVTLRRLQIRQHRRDRLDIRRPRRDDQMTITHFGLRAGAGRPTLPARSLVGRHHRNAPMHRLPDPGLIVGANPVGKTGQTPPQVRPVSLPATDRHRQRNRPRLATCSLATFPACGGLQQHWPEGGEASGEIAQTWQRPTSCEPP